MTNPSTSRSRRTTTTCTDEPRDAATWVARAIRFERLMAELRGGPEARA